MKVIRAAGLSRNHGGMPKAYLAQCHFAMVITGAPYMYFMSYNPGLPAMLIKLERDDYTAKVEVALAAFTKELVAARKQIS